MIGRSIGRGGRGSGDRYASFADLLRREREGRDFIRTIVDRGSAIAIIAPHGGGLEVGTSELATAIAAQDFSLYCFDGIKRRGNEVLHVSSVHFDDPACMNLLSRARTAVSIHGCSGEDMGIRLGGLDARLKAIVIPVLIEAGFVPLDDDAIYSGLDPANLCNRAASGKGLQAELSRGLRRAMFSGLERAEREYTTPVFRRFVTAMRGALLSSIDATPHSASGDGGGNPLPEAGPTKPAGDLL
jgi:phage replication-related protein YjqB (UPF0714/DUF867 family)